MSVFFQRKRLWWWVGAALVLIGLGAGLWRVAAPAEDATWGRVRANGVMVIATDASYPPFSAVDGQGAMFGLDVDLGDALARRVSARAGITLRADFDNLTYDALLPALIAGRDDAVISAFVPQPERLKEVQYTRPYFVGGTLAVVKANAAGPRLEAGAPLTWASGKRLAVEYGAGGDVLARQWARQTQGLTILAKPTAQDALAALAAGQADAALVDALSAYDFLKAQTGWRLAGPPLDPEPYVVAVSIRSPQLWQALEAALAEMEGDGALADLRAKWLGEASRPAP